MLSRRRFTHTGVLAGAGAFLCTTQTRAADTVRYYPVPSGGHPHDVAPARDGGVWYTAQHTGKLGWLDPKTGKTQEIALGQGSAPHGVIVGPDGNAWITDGGQNAIVMVEATGHKVHVFKLPGPYANLNTASFDRQGRIWFTGQQGYYGRLDPAKGTPEVWEAPRGRGPYGIATTPAGDVWFVSFAGSYLARVDLVSGAPTIVDPPTPKAGTRRVWSDSKGRLWTSEYFAGQLGLYDPASGQWREWKMPDGGSQCYAVYVDDRDQVWVTDWGANAIRRFDPASERWSTFKSDRAKAEVRQILGRPGELWGAESGVDRLVVVAG